MTMPWDEPLQPIEAGPSADVAARQADSKIRVQMMAGSMVNAWRAYVNNHPEGTFFHRYEWGEVIENTYGYKPIFLVAIDDEKTAIDPDTNGLVGILPLFYIRSKLTGNRLVSTGYTVGGGLLADSPQAADAIATYACQLKELKRVQYIELRGSSHDLENWKVKDATYAGFVKEISADTDDNLKQIPRKKRADVRKGIKAVEQGNLTVDFNAGIDDVYNLYAESVRNLGTPVFPKKLLHNMKQQFGDDIEFTLVSSGPNPVAGLVSFYHQDTVLPYFGGAKFEARKLHAYDLLYWAQMQHATHRGVTKFDFGRSKIGTGAYDYKGHWGFDAQPLKYFYHLVQANDVPDINPNNPKYKMVTKVWQKLPLPIANSFGPILAKHLG